MSYSTLTKGNYHFHQNTVTAMDKESIDEFLSSAGPNFWKINRVNTYKYWPFAEDEVCNADKMAEAGFVAVGGEQEPDLVECFVCGKQLDGWEPQDDPWREHSKHQPNCEFVKLKKPNERTWTLKEYFTLLKESTKLDMAKQTQEALLTAKNAQQDAIEKIQSLFQERRD